MSSASASATVVPATTTTTTTPEPTTTTTLAPTPTTTTTPTPAAPTTVEIDGVIEALPPTTAAGTFQIAGQTVSFDSSTQLTYEDAQLPVSYVAVGATAHVTATVSAGTTLATLVQIESFATATLQGAISNLTGTATSYSFDVAGSHVTANATTAFDGGTVFADLKNGATVAVSGDVRADGVYATTIRVVVVTDVLPTPELTGPGESAQHKPLVGTISGFQGTAAAFSFDIEGKRVTGSAETEFQAKTTFADLKNGVKAQVWIEARPGAIFAVRIHKTGK